MNNRQKSTLENKPMQRTAKSIVKIVKNRHLLIFVASFVTDVIKQNLVAFNISRKSRW